MTQHHPRRDGDTPLAMLGLDDFETGLLATTRHFFTSFLAPESQGWIRAFREAEALWGAVDGPKSAYAMFTTVDAMRRSRRTMFHFSDPHCPTCRESVTPNERNLMRMIHAIRRGRIGAAQTEALLLTEGIDPAFLLRAAWALAGMFPANQDSEAALGIGHAEARLYQVH
jgi:hypothetical protein